MAYEKEGDKSRWRNRRDVIRSLGVSGLMVSFTTASTLAFSAATEAGEEDEQPAYNGSDTPERAPYNGTATPLGPETESEQEAMEEFDF